MVNKGQQIWGHLVICFILRMMYGTLTFKLTETGVKTFFVRFILRLRCSKTSMYAQVQNPNSYYARIF